MTLKRQQPRAWSEIDKESENSYAPQSEGLVDFRNNVSFVSGSVNGSQGEIDTNIEIDTCIRDPTSAIIAKANSLVNPISNELLSFRISQQQATIPSKINEKHSNL